MLQTTRFNSFKLAAAFVTQPITLLLRLKRMNMFDFISRWFGRNFMQAAAHSGELTVSWWPHADCLPTLH